MNIRWVYVRFSTISKKLKTNLTRGHSWLKKAVFPQEILHICQAFPIILRGNLPLHVFQPVLQIFCVVIKLQQLVSFIQLGP